MIICDGQKRELYAYRNSKTDGDAVCERHLANTIERSVLGVDASCCCHYTTVHGRRFRVTAVRLIQRISRAH